MKTRRERLIALRDKVIKKLPITDRGRDWLGNGKRIAWSQTDWFRQDRKHPCGTTACVAGSAGLLPEFRKAGLKTIKRGGITNANVNTLLSNDGCEITNWFGLKYWEGNILFYGGDRDSLVDDTPKGRRENLVNLINEMIKASPR